MSSLELHPLSPCQSWIISWSKKKKKGCSEKTKTANANKIPREKEEAAFPLSAATSFPKPQHFCCCIQTALKSKRWTRLKANDTLLSGSEDASDVPFDKVFFKGERHWLLAELCKIRLVVELFQRHETEGSSFDHEAAKSNTSLLEKSKNFHMAVLCLSWVWCQGEKPYLPYSFLEILGEWKDINKHSKMLPHRSVHHHNISFTTCLLRAISCSAPKPLWGCGPHSLSINILGTKRQNVSFASQAVVCSGVDVPASLHWAGIRANPQPHNRF